MVELKESPAEQQHKLVPNKQIGGQPVDLNSTQTYIAYKKHVNLVFLDAF